VSYALYDLRGFPLLLFPSTILWYGQKIDNTLCASPASCQVRPINPLVALGQAPSFQRFALADFLTFGFPLLSLSSLSLNCIPLNPHNAIYLLVAGK
jgi:hypothetical protein